MPPLRRHLLSLHGIVEVIDSSGDLTYVAKNALYDETEGGSGSEEERLIRKPVEFVFVQGLRAGDGLTLKLLKWNDGAGEPRLLKVIRDEKNTER